MAKVLVAPMLLAGNRGPYFDILRKADFEMVFPPRPAQLLEHELLEQLQGVAAALAGSEPYTRRVLSAHPQLRVIARTGVGFDAVDIVAATEHGVAVCIAPNTNQEAVAEHTFALMLALAKDVVTQHLAVRQGQWPRRPTAPLRGRQLGIVGLGRIGKAVALRGLAFGMQVVAFEPLPDNEFVKRHGIVLADLDNLLAEADFVSLHVPLAPESRHMINRRTLALMKENAYLINTARGGLIHEADLAVALKAHQIAGAGIDVYSQEPPEEGHPLFGLDNVILTAHAAGVDCQSLDDMSSSAAEAIVSLSRGEWPAEKIVNPEVKTRFRW